MIASPLRPRLLVAGGLLAMAAGMGIGRFIYTPILPFMEEALGYSKSDMGLIASANFIGYLLGAIAAGSPRIGGAPRAWLVGMLGLSAVTTGGIGIAEGMPAFLALRFVGGVASAFVIVFSSYLILNRLAASGHGALTSIHMAGVGTGIAATAVLVWALSWIGLGWREMWMGGGLLAGAAVAAVLVLVPDAPETPVAGAGRAGRSDPRLLALTVAYGLFGFGYVITATFIVSIVRGAPEIRALEPVVWLLFGLAAIPSVPAWIAIGRRIGLAQAFAVACLVEAVGVAASVVSSGAVALVIGAALLGGTFMGLTALGFGAARNLPGVDARRALAQLTAAFGLGQIAGPLVAGYGYDLTGSFFLPSMIAAAGLCLAFVLTIRMRAG